jgi:putative Mn2+ efflux pump MntP
MTFVEILVIALGLSMDALAVSVCATAGGCACGHAAALRLACTFGIFQALMPLLGWLLGAQVAAWFTALDHWIAFGLLAFVGIRMIRSGCRPACAIRGDPSRGLTLLMLGVATSIDAFAVGISFAMLGVEILTPILIIGLVTGALSFTGASLGRRLGRTAGPRLELAGGILLLLIGARILWEHLRV